MDFTKPVYLVIERRRDGIEYPLCWADDYVGSDPTEEAHVTLFASRDLAEAAIPNYIRCHEPPGDPPSEWRVLGFSPQHETVDETTPAHS